MFPYSKVGQLLKTSVSDPKLFTTDPNSSILHYKSQIQILSYCKYLHIEKKLSSFVF